MWGALATLGAGAMSAGAGLYASSKQIGAAADLNAKNRQWQHNEAELARDFDAKQAQQARDWQENLDNTKFQRMVNDLRAAGLNPLLATGMSPSTPSGFSASVGSPSAPNSFLGDYSGIEHAGSALGSSLKSIAMREVEKSKAELAKAKSDVENGKKQGELIDAQKNNINIDSAKKTIDAEKSKAETTKTKVDTYRDVAVPIAQTAATAYAGHNAGKAVKALVGAGLTKNSAAEIVKEVAPKASSSAKQAKNILPALTAVGMYGLPVLTAAGAGYLMFGNDKTSSLYHKGDVKKHDKYMQHGNYSR